MVDLALVDASDNELIILLPKPTKTMQKFKMGRLESEASDLW